VIKITPNQAASGICAVIVAYRRPKLLLKLIGSIRGQSMAADILVWDNDHAGTLRDTLAQAGVLDSPGFHYVRSQANLGGAGGFSNGLKEAEKFGYEYYWLMDDDGVAVDPDCLKKQVRAARLLGGPSIVGALVVDDMREHDRLSFGLCGMERRKDVAAKSQGGILYGGANPFNATLLASGAVRKIGYPREDFFLYGDETEYLKRAGREGVAVVTAVDAVYYHPSNHSKIGVVKIGNRRFPVCDQLPLWKRYVSVRNKAAIQKEYGSRLAYPFYGIFLVATSLCNRQLRRRHLMTSVQAWRDGAAGDFSKSGILPYRDEDWRSIWSGYRQTDRQTDRQ
jgi:rhamnopyranosyl-N-acetylglucosaminyl-diphospho-decaprenol beta-1,3/1,4-galactofuranosyltransferase